MERLLRDDGHRSFEVGVPLRLPEAGSSDLDLRAGYPPGRAADPRIEAPMPRRSSSPSCSPPGARLGDDPRRLVARPGRGEERMAARLADDARAEILLFGSAGLL